MGVFNYDGMKGDAVVNDDGSPVVISDRAGIVKWLKEHPEAHHLRVFVGPYEGFVTVKEYLEAFGGETEPFLSFLKSLFKRGKS